MLFGFRGRSGTSRGGGAGLDKAGWKVPRGLIPGISIGLLAVLGFEGSAAQAPTGLPPGTTVQEIQRLLSESRLTVAQAAVLARSQGVAEEEIQALLGQAQDSTVATTELADTTQAVVEERVEVAPPEIIEDTHPTDELAPFGYAIFETSPDSYRQPAFGPVDPEYPLGPG